MKCNDPRGPACLYCDSPGVRYPCGFRCDTHKPVVPDREAHA